MNRLSSLGIATVAGGLFTVAACGQNDSEQQPDPSESYETVSVGHRNLEKVDLTFVIDDSGSMCDEQAGLAESLDAFVVELAWQPVDFHIGVTTTSADDNGELGALNSQPNPVPRETEECGVDSRLVEVQLERAISCTEDPAAFESVLPLSDEQTNCIDDPTSCAIDGFEIAALFPPATAYRDLPTVMKRSDYLNRNHSLDLESLRDDFQCIAFVGTRGSSFEKGLGALVAANAPRRVGENYEVGNVPMPSAPNYGLVRRDASAAAVIVTDENDCTYSNEGTDYQIDEEGPCGDAACYYASSSQLSSEESPLLSPDSMRQAWRAHLAEIKGRTVDLSELIVASAHGQPARYSGEVPNSAACEEGNVPSIETTCRAVRRSARSGDRYQRFVEGFEVERSWPRSDDAIKGKICTPNYLEGVFDIGPTIRPPSCLTDNPAPCGSDADCATPTVPGTSTTCQDFARSGEQFCASSVDVVLTASGADAEERLGESTLCANGTMVRVDGDVNCVMKRGFYELRPCEANSSGIWPTFVGGADQRAASLGLGVALRWPARSDPS